MKHFEYDAWIAWGRAVALWKLLTLFQVVYLALSCRFSIPSNSYLWLHSQTFLFRPCCLLAGLLQLGRGPVCINTGWASLVFSRTYASCDRTLSTPELKIKSPSKLVNTVALSHPQTVLRTSHFSETVSCQTSDPAHPCFSSTNFTCGLFPCSGAQHNKFSRPSPVEHSCPAESAHTHELKAAQKFKLLL